MFRKLTYVLVAMLLATNLIFAAEPKAVIVSKPTAALHDSVWLQTTGSVGKTFIWKILPAKAIDNFTILPIFGGMNDKSEPIVNYWAHYSSATAGTVYFIFIATEENKSDVAIHTLVYGGGDTIIDTSNKLPEIAKPSDGLVTIVQPLMTLFIGDKVQIKKDASSMAYFYSDIADTISRDSTTKLLKTTEQIRQLNITAGTLMFQQTGVKGRYPGLGTEIDKVLATSIGLDIVDITDTKRIDIVNAFKAIAWSCVEVAKK